MGERKVASKYYPPDFDPSKLQRQRKSKDGNNQIKVRMMLPFSLRCGTCGNFIYQGTKFNARKEEVQNETYLGLRIYRFYFRCPRCAGEIAMKTDPKNSDYVCELGASRNFDPHKEEARQEESLKKKRADEEEGDAMKALENRTLDSKREMDILNNLDQIKTLNDRAAKLNTGDVIAAMRRSAGEAGAGAGPAGPDAEDEEDLQELRLQRARNIRRIDDSAAGAAAGGDQRVSAFASAAAPANKAPAKKRSIGVSFAVKPAVVVKKKPKVEEAEKQEEEEAPATGLAGLVAYSSSDEE